MNHLSESERTFCIIAEYGGWGKSPKAAARYQELMGRKPIKQQVIDKKDSKPSSELKAIIVGDEKKKKKKRQSDYDIIFADVDPEGSAKSTRVDNAVKAANKASKLASMPPPPNRERGRSLEVTPRNPATPRRSVSISTPRARSESVV